MSDHDFQNPPNWQPAFIAAIIAKRSPVTLFTTSTGSGGHVKITVGPDDTLKLNTEPTVKELEHLPEG